MTTITQVYLTSFRTNTSNSVHQIELEGSTFAGRILEPTEFQ